MARKHTPIVSERQRRFFGSEYGRWKRGEATETEMSGAEMRRHLVEASGKNLPERSKKHKFHKSCVPMLEPIEHRHDREPEMR